MSNIDCSDCYLEIAIGDGVKRSLVRHFSRVIASRLRERGIDSTQTAFAIDKVDQDAWRLAAKVLNEVAAELTGALDETLLAPDPQRNAQAILSHTVAAAASAAEHYYVTDDLFGLDTLVGKIGTLADR